MAKTRKIYYQTEEVTTVKKKGYIEIDEDFTQVYKSFSIIAPMLKSVSSWQLLFWILSNASNDQNGVFLTKVEYDKFNKHLNRHGLNITSATFYRCIRDLVEAGCLNKSGSAHYYLNPNIFWSADKLSRIEFIQDEKKDGGFVSVNPLTLQLPDIEEKI